MRGATDVQAAEALAQHARDRAAGGVGAAVVGNVVARDRDRGRGLGDSQRRVGLVDGVVAEPVVGVGERGADGVAAGAHGGGGGVAGAGEGGGDAVVVDHATE